MFTQKVILEDPELKAFFDSIYLNINLRETINISLQATFLPLNDPSQGKYNHRLSLQVVKRVENRS